ncbi:uncharacterized protein [Haliotis asinina]|uniref:uncharacterized protein n=1 Tax=Haliotis asinina TaxID=109174 RepID=UPI003531BAB5
MASQDSLSRYLAECSVAGTDDQPVTETDQQPVTETDQQPVTETDQQPVTEGNDEATETSSTSDTTQGQQFPDSEQQLGSSVDAENTRNSQSSRNSMRSTRSAYAKERARLAELYAEKSLLEQSKKIQELTLDIEIAKMRARERAYADVEDVAPLRHIYTPESISDVKPNVPRILDEFNVKPKVLGFSDESDVKPRVHEVSGGFGVEVDMARNATIPDVHHSVRDNPGNGGPQVNILGEDGINQADVLARQMNPNAKDFKPSYLVTPEDATMSAHTPSSSMQRQHELILQTHRQMATSMLLPQPKVPTFKGDPMAFSTFMMSFDARVVPHTTNNTDRLYYLDQQLEGEPKDLIAGCLHMNSADGYQKARDLLITEYGNPYTVSTAYVNKVLAWPEIRYDDSHGLKQFSYFLIKCLHVMKSMSHMNVLNHAPNMQAVVLKLPIYLQNKWRDHVTKARLQRYKVIAFEDLVQFIEFASKSANEPVYSKDAMSKNEVQLRRQDKDSTRNKQIVHKLKSNSIVTSSNYPDPLERHNKGKRLACYFCKEQHDMDDCKQFARKSLIDKRAYLRDNKMCYGCYGYNHAVKGCMKKRTCKRCGKCHPTALHDDDFHPVRTRQEGLTDTGSDMPKAGGHDIADSVNTSCNYTKSDIVDTVLQPIIPVIVQQRGNEKSVKTYALLDNGSTGCFITEDLKHELGAKSTKSMLKLRTMHGVSEVRTSAVEDLIISDITEENAILLPRTFTKEEIPVGHSQIPNPDVLLTFPHLSDMANKLPQYQPDLDIGLLIGSNCPLAMQPQEVIPSQGNGPFAVRYKHGWTVSGPLHIKYNPSDNSLTCNRAIFQEIHAVQEYPTRDAILKMFEMDFSERDIGTVPGEQGYSREDQKFIEIAKTNMKQVDGHYELPLPLKDPKATFANNREQAERRAKWQKKKMVQNEQYRRDYTAFMENLILKGYAYKIPNDKLTVESGKVRYLPHHGIYHPKKPTKIRVVFDCSAKYDGTSLNDMLLQGPDLTNSLIGVLTRFRTERIAFMADIEAMFYQVKVPPHQHDLLRFLWWPNGDLSADLQEYGMTVHIFGAVSSPSISNFVLRAVADRAEKVYGLPVADTIRNNFYVDDCLKSVSTEETAVKLVDKLKSACEEGGFQLTKFTSNNRDVLNLIPSEHRSKHVQTHDLNYDLLIERALGMQWHISTDMFGFTVDLKEKPFTRRGLLSTMSSLYDPLGIVAPVMLPAKKVLQDLCTNKQLGWDDEIPAEQKLIWKEWLGELQCLNVLRMERCLKPAVFGNVVSTQLHVFSDASTIGYGCVAYLRLCDDKDNIHTAFLMGKSRLAPVKTVSIPRLELTAATVAVHIGQLQLDTKPDSVTYYTDSTTVLHYINSEQKRFPIFVANRVKVIRDFSKPDQWKYIDSKTNPADIASRGVTPSKLIECHDWLKGPTFLMKLSQSGPYNSQLL